MFIDSLCALALVRFHISCCAWEFFLYIFKWMTCIHCWLWQICLRYDQHFTEHVRHVYIMINLVQLVCQNHFSLIIGQVAIESCGRLIFFIILCWRLNIFRHFFFFVFFSIIFYILLFIVAYRPSNLWCTWDIRIKKLELEDCKFVLNIKQQDYFYQSVNFICDLIYDFALFSSEYKTL